VVIVDPRPPPSAEVKGIPHKYIQTDISSWYSITEAFQAAIDQYGTIDYVFANAGIGECDHLFVTPKDDKGRPKAPNYAEVDVK
jgi:NAD(P)-dependent dehydrogenase (short-subunit alcohol dehydrogenase family)